MWDVIGFAVEALFHWLFGREHQWVWVPLGAAILAVGVMVIPSSLAAGVTILAVGLLGLTWGLAGGVFRRGDE